MKQSIHRFSALIAALCISSFFLATVAVELFGTEAAIVAVKSLIVTPGLFILVPAIAITGATGFALGKKRRGPLIQAKKSRMPFIAGMGIFVLIPAALMLNHWASMGLFDTKFYALQIVELTAGATNLVLIGKNIKDGLKLSGKARRKQPQQEQAQE